MRSAEEKLDEICATLEKPFGKSLSSTCIGKWNVSPARKAERLL